MATRIIFNGQEYDSPEAMPPDVRKAYQVMLDQFQDRDKDGIPDVLQGGSAGKNVLGMLQTSVTFNGRTLEGMGLPAPVRRLIGNVIAHGISKGTAPAEPHGNEPLVRALDTASRATGGTVRDAACLRSGLHPHLQRGPHLCHRWRTGALAGSLDRCHRRVATSRLARHPSHTLGAAAGAAPGPEYRRVQSLPGLEQPWFVPGRGSALWPRVVPAVRQSGALRSAAPPGLARVCRWAGGVPVAEEPSSLGSPFKSEDYVFWVFLGSLAALAGIIAWGRRKTGARLVRGAAMIPMPELVTERFVCRLPRSLDSEKVTDLGVWDRPCCPRPSSQ